MITPEQDRILQRLAELAVIAAINKIKSQANEKDRKDSNGSDSVVISHDLRRLHSMDDSSRN